MPTKGAQKSSGGVACQSGQLQPGVWEVRSNALWDVWRTDPDLRHRVLEVHTQQWTGSAQAGT